jgi:hypothetical protein
MASVELAFGVFLAQPKEAGASGTRASLRHRFPLNTSPGEPLGAPKFLAQPRRVASLELQV